MTEEQQEILRKLPILERTERVGNVSKTCLFIGVGRASFYRWRDT